MGEPYAGEGGGSEDEAAGSDGAPLTRSLRAIGMEDVGEVGGKAASLGELYAALGSKGIRVPEGFVTTAAAHRLFLEADVPPGTWRDVPCDDIPALHMRASSRSRLSEALRILLEDADPADALDLHARTAAARAYCDATPVPEPLRLAVERDYADLCRAFDAEVDTAVRSSATREDSDGASFAGQYESFLNVRGIDGILAAWKGCCASAFTERAVSYQLRNGMDPLTGAVSVVVMKMVRSDLAASGVMFTMDPDSGNRNVIHVTSSYGLGEAVVQGAVSPDTFLVWKEGLRRGGAALVHRRMGAKDRKMIYASQGGTATESVDVEAAHRRRWSLRREEVMALARMALTIEEHYGRPMDIEWAKDGYTGDLYIVQARPETVHCRADGVHVLETYSMAPELVEELRSNGALLAKGQAVGTRIAAGKVRRYSSYADVIERKRRLREAVAAGRDLEEVPAGERVFDPGDVLVTEMTTPDWEPLMREASLIVTEKGGRTSHAAIVAREFGIPAIVGCGETARALEPLAEVTGTCAEGETGYVFQGIHPFTIERAELDDEELRTAVKLNVGFPERALNDAMLPCDGVGLARLEFILTSEVGVHPLALLYWSELLDYTRGGPLAEPLAPYEEAIRSSGHEVAAILRAVDRRTAGYADKRRFFVDRVRDGVALICAAFHPRPVLVRLSDLKSNEYRDLLGGRLFEPEEENPMIAWRGASRYVDPRFAPAFEMELEALRFVRQETGLDNLQLMVPFCRTPEEGREVVRILDRHGLSPHGGVPLYLMVELPSNVLEAERFIDEMGLAGGSIGTNDLVQTIYALSRDDLERYPHTVDARAPAVRVMMRRAIQTFSARGLEIGICGQAPSDHPEEVPRFLVECGISSISVTPDTLMRVRKAVAAAEAEAASAGEPSVPAGRSVGRDRQRREPAEKQRDLVAAHGV